MKVGSLFDGSGGFPLASSMCGILPVWASEVEPYPIAVTRSRFPEMVHLGDVQAIHGSEIEPVDVITFGSPCQDMSVAGKRAGLKHEGNGDEETTRSGLFMEAVRIIKEMREASNGEYPRFAVWENVPGAFSSNKGEDFRLVLQEFVKIIEPQAVMPPVPKNGWAYADSYRGDGWSLAYRVFDAQYWGVPQRRRRIYLVADFGGTSAEKVLFEREGLRRNLKKSGETREGVARGSDESVGGADCLDGCLTPWDHQSRRIFSSEGIFNALNSREKSGQDQSAVLTKICLDDQGGQQLNVRTDGIAPTLRAETHGNLPCVIDAVGLDGYNSTTTGDVSSTLGVNCGMSTGRNGVVVNCAGFKGKQSSGAGGIGWKEEQAPTLLVGQEAHVIYALENHPMDSRVKLSDGNIIQTLSARMGTGGGNVPIVMEQKCFGVGRDSKATNIEEVQPSLTKSGVGYIAQPYCAQEIVLTLEPEPKTYCVQGNAIDRSETAGCNGKGWKQDVSFTLNTVDRYAICVPEVIPINDKATRFQNGGSSRNGDGCGNGLGVGKHGDPSPTLTAADRHSVCCAESETIPHYIVRRLTPTECARLQGFPDGWGTPEYKENFTEEEYRFWLDVRNTHAKINEKAERGYSKESMLKWYNKLHTDSAEYKMWGNGIALPCALYVMEGISEEVENAKKD